jgi:HD-GYP domain-containing protein (c-di-GMP phosphodiesterase class II)
MAALLHDVGKLGVPDAILLKPGQLTPDEWKIIKSHEDIGQDLIAAAFPSKPLLDIIRGHHFRYEGDPKRKGIPKESEIPLPARILAIANAYDSMVSEQVYRKKLSQQDAFLELQRHAGTQFDPNLVEVFIQRVMERDQGRQLVAAS